MKYQFFFAEVELSPIFKFTSAVGLCFVCCFSSITQSVIKEEVLRDDLKYYFMSPCEKYRARGQVPWKLGVQILKIVMITTQVVYIMAIK